MPNLQSLMPDAQSLLLAEHERWVLWLPVGIGTGIGLYFILPTEPPVWLGPVLLLFPLALGLWGWKRGFVFRFIALVLLLGMLGFSSAQVETWRMQSPILRKPTRIGMVEGRVIEKQVLPEGARLLLEPSRIERVMDDIPGRIRISFKKTQLPEIDTGDNVRLRAGLYPPPGPVLPGSFDFSRYFYFQGIGAVGFGLAPVETLAPGEASGWREGVTVLRQRLTNYIREVMISPFGPVAAALITGETSTIPEEVSNTMREAGLAHLLAVSGMNLAIVAGTLFFLTRFALAAIPLIAGRWNIKKWAAILALLGSAVYLAICGAPVSAQRAFLMTFLLLSAILLDRVVTPARSIAWAAVLVLLLFPHTLLEPGFQLSFAATLALVASFESVQPHIVAALGARRILLYIAGIFLTSLVAGLATMPYTLYHFSDFSTYSLLANVLAAPLVTFWIMPAAVLALLALPFGLDGAFFFVMKWGIAAMLGMAEWVAKLPEAFLHPPPISDLGLLMLTFGGLWLLLWQKTWRWYGLIPVAIGFLTIFQYSSPDIFLAEEGKRIAVKLADGRMVALRGRTEGFGAEEWLRAGGQEALLRRGDTKHNHNLRCDAMGCVYEKQALRVAFPRRREALEDDCALAQLVVYSEGYMDGECTAGLLDRGNLHQEGAIAIWLGKEIYWRSARQEQGERPWSGYKNLNPWR